MQQLEAQNKALWDALSAANRENERLTELLQNLTVELCVAEDQTNKALKQVDLLRGTG